MFSEYTLYFYVVLCDDGRQNAFLSDKGERRRRQVNVLKALIRNVELLSSTQFDLMANGTHAELISIFSRFELSQKLKLSSLKRAFILETLC